jgi:hypothetical protein
MRLIFFYIMTVFGILGCQTKPAAPETIKILDCYIRILEAEENVLIQATMKLAPAGSASSGNAVPVEVKGGIRYQGGPMTVLPTAGLTYQKAFPGKFIAEHVFSWDDPAKGRLSFTVQMNNIPGFTFSPKILSASKPAALTWDGAGLERGEALTLIWENAKDNLTVPMDLYVQGQFPRVDFPAAKMKELSPGSWTVYIVRKKLVKTDVSGVAAQAVAEFYSKTVPVEIVK